MFSICKCSSKVVKVFKVLYLCMRFHAKDENVLKTFHLEFSLFLGLFFLERENCWVSHFRESPLQFLHLSIWSQSSFHFTLTLPWSLLTHVSKWWFCRVRHVVIFLIKSFDKHQDEIRIINMSKKHIKRLVASFKRSYFYVFMFPFITFTYFCKCYSSFYR